MPRQASRIERRIGSDEKLITLTEAAKLLPKVNGKKPALCTLWRWCRRGLRGVFLAQTSQKIILANGR